MIPRVVLYAYDQFNAFVFNAPQAIFGAKIEKRELFKLSVASIDGKDKQAEIGLTVSVDGDLSLFDQADMIVIAGWNCEQPPEELLLKLKEAYHRGTQIIGLCYGTYVLAYAGILDNKPAVTHWLAEQDFTARFPKVRLDSNQLYIRADNIITSAGAAAGLDCCLEIVRQYYGSKVANDLARIMVIPPHREGGQAQFIKQPVAKSTQNNPINILLDELRKEISQPYSIETLAKRMAMSRRTFTRHFRKTTGMSFQQWLIQERLRQSQYLLENTRLSIGQIAEKIGFHTEASFRQHFRQCFAVNPSQWRKVFVGKQHLENNHFEPDIY